MNLTTFEQLRQPTGHAALQLAATWDIKESTRLQALTRLRRAHDADLAEAIVETMLLRQRGRSKYTRADGMYFVREALEQSTSEVVARHRAQRYRDYATVGDFACGIGGDTIALASVTTVIAVDRDPLRLAMAQANAEVYEVAERARFACVDLQHERPSVDAAFVDPARRIHGHRHVDIRDYEPSWEVVRSWGIEALGVKLSPAVALESLDADGEIEFIAVGSELKECVVWYGALRSAERRATLLPSGHTLTGTDQYVDSGEPGDYVYDPNPAVTRAGLMGTLAAQLNAHGFDPTERYLTSMNATMTPFAQVLRITAAMPYDLKRLRAHLRSEQVGRIEIRQRAVSMNAATLQRDLRLEGPGFAVVVLVQRGAAIWVLVTTPVADG